MFTVSSGFIGIFKIGDNINFNLKILELLYDSYNTLPSDRKKLLCKPIIILLVSIIEAVLYDFHLRVSRFYKEGVTNLGLGVISYIRQRKIEDFKKYIDSAKRHNLLDANNPDFYLKLDFLRKIRHRVHIQNKENELEPDDSYVFTEQRKTLAEEILEQTLKVLAQKYPRPRGAAGFVADFVLPWSEHIIPPPSVSTQGYLEWIEEYYGHSIEELRLLGFL